MSPTSTVVRPDPGRSAGLVRVTVASSSRRVDLAIPGAVPLAELVPELARSVGVLDPLTVHGGYTVSTHDGRRLSGDVGLVAQGVEDGALLAVGVSVEADPPRVYDDVVEAMADVVERDHRPWSPASGRRTALVAAGLLLLLGAGGLLRTDSVTAGTAAAVVAGVLLAGAVLLSRVRHEPGAAVAVAWGASLFAAVAGMLLAPGGDRLGVPAAAAGLGAVLVGLVAVLAVADGRPLVLPPAVVGTVFLAVSGGLHGFDVDAGAVLVGLLVLLVLCGSVLPGLALGLGGRGVEQVHRTADTAAAPTELADRAGLADLGGVDPVAVAVDARLAHQILMAMIATVGLLLVVVAPVAVRTGVTGTVLAGVCAVVLLLRTRRHRSGSEVLAGLVGGILGLVSVTVSVLWLHPDWRPVASVASSVGGMVLLAATLLPGAPSVRRGHLGDVAETGATLSLLPLAVVATGLFTTISGWG